VRDGAQRLPRRARTEREAEAGITSTLDGSPDQNLKVRHGNALPKVQQLAWTNVSQGEQLPCIYPQLVQRHRDCTHD
jgi:hypothetical protein